MTTLAIIIFIIYFANNVIPKKAKKEFDNISHDNSFIKNYSIEKQNARIAIYLDTTSEIFKQYNYHSYISGEGTGRKINLQMYLISEDSCYQIKTHCYEYTNAENLKFIGYYYNKFIKQNEKYNLAIYVPENEILYKTNIEI